MRNEYEIIGDTTEIYCTYKGEIFTVLIDTEDLPLLDEFCKGAWTIVFNKKKYYYAKYGKWIPESRSTTSIMMHRVIMGDPKGMVIDHIHHNTLDNRKSNLRVLTNAENIQNRSGLQSNNKSGVSGLCWNKNDKAWIGKIVVKGKAYNVGYWKELEFEMAKKAMIEAYEELQKYRSIKGVLVDAL